MSGFSIQSAVLLREAKLAQEFIGRSCKPIERCVKLAVDQGQATIATTHGAVTLTRHLDIFPGPGDFAAVVPAEYLASIPKECPGTLAIESGTLKEQPCVVLRHIEKTTATANVPAGLMASEFRLLTEDLEAFPSSVPLACSFRVLTVKAAELVEAIRWALPAGGDSTRYGLILRVEDQTLTVGATNGFTLAFYGGVKIQPARRSTKPLVMPLDVGERLLSVLEREAKACPDSPIDLRFDEANETFCIQGDHWHMNAPASSEFPEAAWDLLQREDTTHAVMPANDFKRAFKTICAAAKQDKLPLLAIRVGPDGQLTLHAGNTVERRIAGAARGRAVEVQVPLRHLKPWLANVPKGDWIGVCATTPCDPIVFTCTSRLNATWTMAGQRKAKKKEAVAAA